MNSKNITFICAIIVILILPSSALYPGENEYNTYCVNFHIDCADITCDTLIVSNVTLIDKCVTYNVYVPPDIIPREYTCELKLNEYVYTVPRRRRSGNGGGRIPVTPSKPKPSCFDGILNQDEEGIDCGGVCKPCISCFDGIQNQDETGIDCGGVCKPCESIIIPPYYIRKCAGDYVWLYDIQKGEYKNIIRKCDFGCDKSTGSCIEKKITPTFITTTTTVPTTTTISEYAPNYWFLLLLLMLILISAMFLEGKHRRLAEGKSKVEK